MPTSVAEPTRGGGRWVDALQGALAVAAVAVIVALWAFPDAVARLRRAWMGYAEAPADCNLATSPCTATFDDGVAVTVSVQGGAPAAPLTWRVTTTGGEPPGEVELQGRDMAMGIAWVPLAAVDGVYVGEGAVPACTVAQMTWRADVRVGDRVAGFTLTTRK